MHLDVVVGINHVCIKFTSYVHVEFRGENPLLSQKVSIVHYWQNRGFPLVSNEVHLQSIFVLHVIFFGFTHSDAKLIIANEEKKNENLHLKSTIFDCN